MLRFSVDTADPATGALLQRVQEQGTGIETALLFFELEWAALDDERAEALLAAEGLDFARHHLRTSRRYRPHLLSEPEEKILAEKQLTGRSAGTGCSPSRRRRSRCNSTTSPTRRWKWRSRA
jgi:oligoendopeptidase F